MTRRDLVERIERARPARLRRWLVAIVVLVMLGMITHGNYAATGDAPHYMMIAHSIAFDRDLALANDYGDPSNILHLTPGLHARVGRNGVLRPVHDIGLPVVAAPFFDVAYRLAALTNHLPESLRRRAKLTPFIALRQLVSVFMIGLTALLALVFFDVAWRLTERKAFSFLWAILWTLSPPVLSHGYVFFAEIPSALVALFVYARLDDLRGARPIRQGAILGLLTGLLFLIHVRNVGLILALILLAAWRVRHERWRGTGFAAGLCTMGVAKIALNLRFWGTIVTTPHERFAGWPGTAAFFSEMAIRAGGLLFDARHGLLLSAPIYLLAPAAWMLLRRRSRAGRFASYELLLLAAAYLLFVLMPVTNVHGWRGGWSPAARYLVPIAPLLAVAVPGLAVEALAGILTGAVVMIQLAIDAFFWGHPMQFWTVGPGPAPLIEALAGSRIAGLVPVWERLNGPTLLVLCAGLALWSLLTWVLVREAVHEHLSPAEPAAMTSD
jgi:hypothetical protein